MDKEKLINLTDIYYPCDNEVVFEMDIKEMTESGIYFPEKYSEWDPELERLVKREFESGKDPVCKVIAIGPNVKRCKVGDYVIVALRGYPQITLLDDRNHLQCREMDILGLVSPNYKEMQTVYKVRHKQAQEAKRIAEHESVMAKLKGGKDA